jgi:Tfp pilus assembly protein PilN
MINLLPPETKQDYHFARRNSWLLHWVWMIAFGWLGLAGLCGFGWVYLHQAANTHAVQAKQAEQILAEQKQAETEAQIKDISSSLKLAVQVLSKEVLFSQLLKQLAAVTPPNVTLNNLSISQLQGSVDITAKAIDYPAATQLHTNLADPANQIFSKADIVSISCTAVGGGPNVSRYPCTVTVRALFTTPNPYLFINNKAKN